MKTKITLLFSLFVIVLSCSYDLDDSLSAKPNINSVEVIRSDSDLFDNLLEITNNEDRPDKSIACIDFIYPLTIFIFDNNDEYVSTNSVTSDTQFSTLLNDLEVEYSISVSFPITSTLLSGETFIVNTKEELKIAIDNCLEEELLLECTTVIQNCVSKVGYSYNYENTYLGGIFQESNGFTTLLVDDNLYSGSWSPLFIENELHINISLNNDSEVAEFFNFDWKVEFLDENSLLLTNEEREIVLNQRCDDDFTECGNFIFEECETEIDSGISEFILDDYSACIFDTLELDDEFQILYFETEEDATNLENPIISSEPYNNIEAEQTIYVKIIDAENDMEYTILITLSSIAC